MAGIELQLNNLDLAEHYANQSLDFNRFNFNAFKVLVIVYRQQGNPDLADKMTENILALDPLNHFAGLNIIYYILLPKIYPRLSQPSGTNCPIRLIWSWQSIIIILDRKQMRFRF